VGAVGVAAGAQATINKLTKTSIETTERNFFITPPNALFSGIGFLPE
jgi:hypothetical protein